MKSIEELREFFELNIKPNLEELEAKRKKIRRKIIIYHFLFGFATLAILCFYVFILIRGWNDVKALKYGKDVFFLSQFGIACLFASVLLPLCSSWLKTMRKNVPFRNEFKEAVIGPIVNFLEPQLKYNPEDVFVPGVLVLGSEIFPHSSYYPEGYWAEDFVEGMFGQTKFEFFEINYDSIYEHPYAKKLYKGVNPIDLKSDYDIPERIPFRGLFFVAEFNKSFKGCTLIRPDDIGIWPQWLRVTKREPVRLEDPEFEKLFAVYSTDQITARYILSTSLMKRITDYKNKVGRAIHISFIRNKIFIAIGHKKNSFEINIYKSLYDFDNSREYYNDFRIALDIIEDLNLNTQIWLKSGEGQVSEMPKLSDYPFKKRIIYMFLAVVFGFIGIHNFYAGYKKRGANQLLITLLGQLVGPYSIIVTFFVWAWAFIEMLRFTVDGNGDPMK
jgi:TM2 domain-containing membrane protein YozV